MQHTLENSQVLEHRSTLSCMFSLKITGTYERESGAPPRWRPDSGETVTQRKQVPKVNKSQRSERLIGKQNVLPAANGKQPTANSTGRGQVSSGPDSPSPIPIPALSLLRGKKTHPMLIQGMRRHSSRQIPSRLCGPDLYQNTGRFITSLRPPLGICVNVECLLRAVTTSTAPKNAAVLWALHTLSALAELASY